MSDIGLSPLAARKLQAREKLERAKAKLQKIEAVERSQTRKAELRRKTLIGEKILEKSRTNANLNKYVLSLIAEMPDREKLLFQQLASEMQERLPQDPHRPD
jgi:hypothetical protein